MYRRSMQARLTLGARTGSWERLSSAPARWQSRAGCQSSIGGASPAAQPSICLCARVKTTSHADKPHPCASFSLARDSPPGRFLQAPCTTDPALALRLRSRQRRASGRSAGFSRSRCFPRGRHRGGLRKRYYAKHQQTQERQSGAPRARIRAESPHLATLLAPAPRRLRTCLGAVCLYASFHPTVCAAPRRSNSCFSNS